MSDKSRNALELERQFVYSNFVNEETKISYINSIKNITQIIEKLIDNNLIASDNVKFIGRIKGFNSANNNDGQKTLDDVFAGKVIALSMEDLSKIIDEILDSSGLTIQQIKVSGPETNGNMKKLCDQYKREGYKIKYKERPDGYETVTLMLYDKEDENCPVIELQFKTAEMEKRCTVGDLRHAKWKKEASSKKILRMIRSGILPELPLHAFCWEPKCQLRTIKEKLELLMTFYPALSIEDVENALNAKKRFEQLLNEYEGDEL